MTIALYIVFKKRKRLGHMQLAGSELVPTRMKARRGPQRKRQLAWPSDMHSIAADGLLLLWVGRSKYCFNKMLQAEYAAVAAYYGKSKACSKMPL